MSLVTTNNSIIDEIFLGVSCTLSNRYFLQKEKNCRRINITNIINFLQGQFTLGDKELKIRLAKR